MDPELNRRTLASEGAGFVPGYPQSMLDILGPNNIAAVHGPLHRAMRGAMLALTRPTMIRAALLPKIDAFMRAHLHGWAARRVVDIQEMTKEVGFGYTRCCVALTRRCSSSPHALLSIALPSCLALRC
jgi:brassinosteroid-6-oxidase 2